MYVCTDNERICMNVRLYVSKYNSGLHLENWLREDEI